MWWLARWEYRPADFAFSELWAADQPEADQLAWLYRFEPPKRLRRPVPEFRPSRLALLTGGLARPDVMHSLCYLSMLAGRAELATVDEVVGEGSPLHELAHYLGVGPNVMGGRMRQFLMERIGWLEHLLPGMPPDDLELAPAKNIRDVGRAIEWSTAP